MMAHDPIDYELTDDGACVNDDQYPVDRTVHSCCGVIGGHASGCRDDSQTDNESNRILAEGLKAVEEWRAENSAIAMARESQPQRLAQARDEAEEAREASLLAEPWESEVSALRGYTSDGRLSPEAIHLPNIPAKGLFGIRLAFDMLDAGQDWDLLDEVKARAFAMVGGDLGQAFLLFASALEIVSSLVVPQLLDEIERGGDWDTRIRLAEARTKAWNDRMPTFRNALDNFNGGDMETLS